MDTDLLQVSILLRVDRLTAALVFDANCNTILRNTLEAPVRLLPHGPDIVGTSYSRSTVIWVTSLLDVELSLVVEMAEVHGVSNSSTVVKKSELQSYT